MKKLSIDFAFEGFRILRDRPWLFAVWGGVALVFNLLSFALMPVISPGGGLSPESLAWNAANLVLALIMGAIMSCAVYRLAQGGSPAGFGFMRIGADELRQGLLMVLYVIIVAALYLAFSLVGVLLGTVLNAILGWAGRLIVILLVILGVTWVMGRLSLFGPQSFDQKKFNVFGSWELTEGYGWTLFLGYVLMFIVIAVLWLAAYGLLAAMTGDSLMTVASRFEDAGAQGAALFQSPPLLIYTVLTSLILGPISTALFHGAPVAAYRALAGSSKRVENLF